MCYASHARLAAALSRRYEGFMANTRTANTPDSRGSSINGEGGANYVCMHESPEYIDGDTFDDNTAGDLYGVEFGCTGDLRPPTEESGYTSGTRSCGDSSRALAAACVVCERPYTTQT